ncbi:BZ3500_MvSof-1268-A1-R1_Chr1-2g01496 [Microbotryum saponariae]|uniref:BZ3500_MvSof-1268-A1-R1_Chr1-2g01496 protein n=1 Tax=Microbotryum saponariae TaxID=289078 RepID=A0A2X0MXH8_9BASI|nr:BZ3500_MvSof-1268-A1-R1_Chr1-2g01496 [Microbotryum saponariae]SCZ97504.1 BZ3501_MvSof-1269-A2-R1_Chr1-2g01095 [Microbotryum saponariae]
MIKKVVGTGTVADILIRLQALLNVGPPPTGMDTFAKYQATTIELFNTLSGHGLTFKQIVLFRLVHFGKDMYRKYYTQTLRQGLDKLPSPMESLLCDPWPQHYYVILVPRLLKLATSSPTPLV